MNLELELTEGEQYTIWRKRNGVTLKEVADYIGCTPALLSLLETGKSRVSRRIVKSYNEFIDQFESED